MFWTQNETVAKAEGGRQKAEGQRLRFSRRPSSFSPHPSAFTLTELLVVITIIAILAGLITGAAVNALGRAKEAAITAELQQIGGSIEDLKNDLGAYPPNAMVKPSAPTNILAQDDILRMFKKAFPRNQEPPRLIYALAGVTGNVQNNNDVELLPGGMTGAEAVFFWLGGFSSDVQYPISGPGGPSFAVDNSVSGNGEVLEDRNLRYEFDLGRLGPRTAEGVFDSSSGNGRSITYTDPRTGNLRRINFWQYTPQGSQQPIVYYDCSRHLPAEYDLPIFGYDGNSIREPQVYAIKKFREGTAARQNPEDIRFVEDKKFQVLHCGTDDVWGNFTGFSYLDNGYAGVTVAPEGPFIGDIADTLGNFMTGTLEDKQE